MLPLLVFAHRGEAGSFLRKDAPWERCEGKLYQNKRVFLLICGEGVMDAAVHTTAVLSKYGEHISSVVNLGIAGSLCGEIEVDSIVHPRSVYFHDGHEMQFSSFQGGGVRPFDLITTSSRVLDADSRDYFSRFGNLVDREAWGICYASKKFHKQCKIFKLITDQSGDPEICQRLREKSVFYSDRLHHFFSTIDFERFSLCREKETKPPLLPEGFYFALSQKRLFFNLVSAHPEGIDKMIENIRVTYPKKSPKEKTKILLRLLQDKLNPTMAKMRKRLRELSKDFQNDQFKVVFDDDSSNLWINAHIRDIHDFESLKKRLHTLSYRNIRKVLDGDGDVP